MDTISRVEGLILSRRWSDMQTHALLNVNRDLLSPFFERVPELFDKYHNDPESNPELYEELLYKIHRPMTIEMLDMIDDWMGLEHRRFCLLYTSPSP